MIVPEIGQDSTEYPSTVQGSRGLRVDSAPFALGVSRRGMVRRVFRPPAQRRPSAPRRQTTHRRPPFVASAPRPEGWAVVAASSRRARRRGLLGVGELHSRQGLWLPVRSVHTIGMRFALDLVWLDRAGDVLRIDEHVGRGRIRTCLVAGGGVVEVAAGRGPALADALTRP
jgi:uncharacterized membrane protein (UPF0127 family)